MISREPPAAAPAPVDEQAALAIDPAAAQTLDQAERDTIVLALRHSDGNRAAAATALGIARSTLYRKIAQYGITG